MSVTTLHEPCVKCKGNGQTWVIEPDSDDRGLRDDCPDCGGTGRVDSPAALAKIAGLTAEVDRLSKRVELAEATIAEMNRLDVLAAETQEVIDRAHEAECDRLQKQRDDLANIVARLAIDPETIRRSEEDFKAGRYRNLTDIIAEHAAGLLSADAPAAGEGEVGG